VGEGTLKKALDDDVWLSAKWDTDEKEIGRGEEY